MAISTLLYDSKIWTLGSKSLSRIQAAEMKFLRSVNGCTILDKIRNEDNTQRTKEFLYKGQNPGVPLGLVGPHPTNAMQKNY